MKRNLSSAFGSVLLALIGFNVAQAQHTLVIDSTNQPDAVVFADSVALGRAAERVFHFREGVKQIHVVPPDLGAWSIRALSFAVEPSRDTLSIDARFPYYYSLRSAPPGASVRIQNATDAIGVTPLVFTRDEPLSGNLVVSLDGFGSRSVASASRLWNHFDIELQSEGTAKLPYVSRPPKQRNRWISVAALSLAAVGGAAAVHFKFKADRRYKVYEETGDPLLRPAIKRLDIQSGVSLGVMQLGVTVFVIRLVRR